MRRRGGTCSEVTTDPRNGRMNDGMFKELERWRGEEYREGNREDLVELATLDFYDDGINGWVSGRGCVLN